ncbi:MAG: DUF4290 domain-containing protein [Chitinophagales bacterium]|nr:DUF4290 domain-containing protein [Chitinophagales bacterium]
MQYNTQRGHLFLKEYGRHIQHLVEYAVSINDKNKRQQVVEEIIQIMGNLNPQLKNVDDFKHLLWDHLHIMSDFKLDVDSPYPIPTKETVYAKPDKFDYPTKIKKNRHYGKNVMSMIEKAIAMKDEEKKEGYSTCIANYMKMVHNNWNSETVTDETILNDLLLLSGHALTLDKDDVTLNKVKNTKRTHNNNNKNYRKTTGRVKTTNYKKKKL